MDLKAKIDGLLADSTEPPPETEPPTRDVLEIARSVDVLEDCNICPDDCGGLLISWKCPSGILTVGILKDGTVSAAFNEFTRGTSVDPGAFNIIRVKPKTL